MVRLPGSKSKNKDKIVGIIILDRAIEIRKIRNVSHFHEKFFFED